MDTDRTKRYLSREEEKARCANQEKAPTESGSSSGNVSSVHSKQPTNDSSSMKTFGSKGSSAVRLRLQAEAKAAEEMLVVQQEIERKRLNRMKAQIEADRKLAEAEEEAEKRLLEIRKNVNDKKLAFQLSQIDEEEADCDDKSQKLSDDDKISVKEMSSHEKVENWSVEEVRPPSPIDKLTDAITQAFKNIAGNSNPKSDTDMKKYLARQSIAKVLPEYSGEPDEWPTFISEFRGSTEDCGFSERENMARLRKCLKGKAKEAVQAMMVTPENLDRVIKTLEKKFGRPDVVVNSLIEKAKKIFSPSEDKPESLIDFSNAITNLVMTMETLKAPGHMTNPHLISELVLKLPSALRLQWGMYCELKDESVTLKNLSDWMEKISDAACYIRKPSCSTEIKKSSYQSRGNYRNEKVMSTTESHSEAKSTGKFYPCTYCGKMKHALRNCWEFEKLTPDDRWKWATEKRICFSCLKTGHQTTKCEIKVKCGKDGCERHHHHLLHKKSEEKKTEEKKIEEKKPVEESASSQPTNATFEPEPEKVVLLQILPVTLIGPEGKFDTFAMLDNCSTSSIIDATVAEKIGADGPSVVFRTRGVTPATVEHDGSKLVSIQICGRHSSQIYQMEGVKTSKNMSCHTQSINMKKFYEKWGYLRKVTLPSYVNAKPTILIGADHMHLIQPRETVDGPKNSPVLSRTKLGWVIHGNAMKFKNATEDVCCHIRYDEEEDSLHRLVKESFSTESFGVRVLKSLPKSKDDERALQIISETTKRIGQRFETGLLWRHDNVSLPPSKNMALKRLNIIERKMDSDLEYGNQYCDKINDYIKKGFARKLQPEEAAKETKMTWYLPHFAVVNPNKPGKMRIVFDAAAVSNNTSLNMNLLPGPDLVTPLQKVLLGFRRKRVGFCGDIREMFPMVKIRQEDLCAQRFLFRGMERNCEPDVYVMTVMIFGATCSPCLAQVCKNRNADDHAEEYPAAAEAIKNCHYVDDYLDSVNTEEESVKLINDVKKVHSFGGFDITNWICSSQHVLEQILSEEEKSTRDLKNKKDLTLGNEVPTERVLGLQWDPNEDEFFFRCVFHKVANDIITGKRRPTKREVLRLIASIYDVLGFLCTFVVRAKIIMKEIWMSGIGWDDELPDDINDKWLKWIQDLPKIENIRIPRCYSWRIAEANSVQLHVFCDASSKAFAAVAYLRIKTDDGVDIAFVMGRSRVTPVKLISIPRAELQAAVMGARLKNTIIDIIGDIKIDSITFWTDSKTVLYWLYSDSRRYALFVAHRVGEILELTDIENWRWIPTAENVADDATRDTKPCDLNSDCRWLHGPDFLKLNEEDWPQERKRFRPEDLDDQNDLELKAEFVNVTIQVETNHLPDIARFSKWSRLIRSTAWVHRFIKNCRVKKSERIYGELTPSECNWAVWEWLKKSQMDCFEQEIIAIKKNKALPKESRLLKLSPILDGKGILRVKGRCAKSPEMTYNAKKPVILHPKHMFTRLLIEHYHVKAGHNGQEYVANELRQVYWILDLRTAVRSVWSRCQRCKNARAVPVPPEMGNLPDMRLTKQTRPFTIVGVDYFGPMNVTIGRRREKRWGVIFTCLSTRAVHLEIAASLSTDSAIMAIQRMAGRRGWPKELYSDNGTNFRGADAELKKSIMELDQDQIKETMTENGVDWHFIPAGAPHMAGSWERLVQSVKKALKIVLTEKAPREEALQTFFVEAEHIVNSRPLTHVSLDPEDEEALTPNHFLIGSSSGARQLGIFTDVDLCLRKQWRIAQRMTDHFWNRWVKEYLPTLTRRTKWNKTTEPIKTGDLVVIVDETLPKNYWPKGIVAAVYPGKDGIVRVVDVKTNFKIYRRPVAKLCKLEVKKDVVDTPDGASRGEECSRALELGASKEEPSTSELNQL